MQFNNQKTRNVADVVAQILAGQTVSEELKGNQHKIDKNKNNKIDAEDFKMLRGEKSMKEEKEESCEDEAKEAVKKHEKKHHGKDGEVAKHEKEMHKEESEQLDEYDSKEGRYVHKGTYGYSGKGAEHGQTDYKKANDDEKMADKKKPARKGYGARQNFVRSYAKESFSGLLDVYREGGLKSLHEALIVEEPTNDEFKKELDDHKAKAELRKKQPDLAKPSVQAVKVEENVELEEGLLDTIKRGFATGMQDNLKEEVVSEDDDFVAKAAHSAGLRHGREGVGNNMDRAKKEWGQHFKHYNTGFLKGRNEKAKDLKAVGQGYGKRQQGMAKEDVEQIDELSSDTLKSYKSVAKADREEHKDNMHADDLGQVKHAMKMDKKRREGINKANARLSPNSYWNQRRGKTNEDVELDERSLTEPEMKKKEEYVKGMKKSVAGFKDRYGDRAKSVMYATATKMAKKD